MSFGIDNTITLLGKQGKEQFVIERFSKLKNNDNNSIPGKSIISSLLMNKDFIVDITSLLQKENKCIKALIFL